MPSQRTSQRITEETESPTRGSRLRFELLFISLWLAFGLFVVPAVVYGIYRAELGPYGENAGLGTFYGAYFADLASLTGRTWLLALGPLIAMSMIRVLYIGVRDGSASQDDLDDEPEKPSKAPAESRRVEPRVES